MDWQQRIEQNVDELIRLTEINRQLIRELKNKINGSAGEAVAKLDKELNTWKMKIK